MYCFLQFNKTRYTLQKNTYLNIFPSKREQMKMLSDNQDNFSVETWQGKISACFSLTVDYSG